MSVKTNTQENEDTKGKEYWRSLDELGDSPEFKEFLHREFPVDASVWEDSVSRRSFLRVMGASFALAGLNSCVKQPDEKILPYVKQPEYLVPGKPLKFATAFVMGGYATGVLVTSHMGRPTRVEGNPDHPASLGSADIFSQASILSLYDPDRSKAILHDGEISTWNKFLEAIQPALEAQQNIGGRGLRFLTGAITSPTLLSQIREIRNRYPESRWYTYEPLGNGNVKAGTLLAFGEVLEVHYHFEMADVILSIDSDFLSGPGSIRHARGFAARRRVEGSTADMNRLYVAEAMPTVTGGSADHRLRISPAEVELLTRRLAKLLGASADGEALGEKSEQWISAVAEDLRNHAGRSVVLVGREQSPQVHALVHAINSVLSNLGQTVTFTTPPDAHDGLQTEDLSDLEREIGRGDVDILLVAGSNPVYSLPADSPLRSVIGKVKMSVHLGPYVDETAAVCSWHIPESHYLESWGDARSADGTATILQPLIAPLYGGTRSLVELLTEVAGIPGRKGYDVVREYWRAASGAEGFEQLWKTSLHSGVVAGSAVPPINPVLRFTPGVYGGAHASEGLEVQFRPDPSIWDGSFANNGWLQELPKPVSKLTWDNAAFISPETAGHLDVETGEVVEVTLNGKSIEIPVMITPGHADKVVTLHTGYGRAFSGNVGNGIGANVNLLRSLSSPWYASGAQVRKTGSNHPLAVTQDHHSMEGREIVRAADVAEFHEHPDFAKHKAHSPGDHETLYPPYEYDSYAWGMSIDLNACTGCNACTIACQSENNIPIVGKEEVLNAREMHWIRIDRYFKGDINDPEIFSQPVPCMHCENAPCEVVCPVAATTHDHEGLNVMTYNRCVGTRYCSNNCPYKVRRFNFLQYSETEEESVKLMHNPDVTVRNRGVMEKCTYCVQRISSARITAKKEGREIRDGEVVTACQSACPSQAIVFGDINNKESRVAAAKADPRDYSLLAELNTKPRTSYMARLRNPNPAMIE